MPRRGLLGWFVKPPEVTQLMVLHGWKLLTWNLWVVVGIVIYLALLVAAFVAWPKRPQRAVLPIMAFYIVAAEEQIKRGEVGPNQVRGYKRLGFSDRQLAALLGRGEDDVRAERLSHGTRAVYARVDTPLVGPRDYVLEVRVIRRAADDRAR